MKYLVTTSRNGDLVYYTVDGKGISKDHYEDIDFLVDMYFKKALYKTVLDSKLEDGKVLKVIHYSLGGMSIEEDSILFDDRALNAGALEHFRSLEFEVPTVKKETQKSKKKREKANKKLCQKLFHKFVMTGEVGELDSGCDPKELFVTMLNDKNLLVNNEKVPLPNSLKNKERMSVTTAIVLLCVMGALAILSEVNPEILMIAAENLRTNTFFEYLTKILDGTLANIDLKKSTELLKSLNTTFSAATIILSIHFTAMMAIIKTDSIQAEWNMPSYEKFIRRFAQEYDIFCEVNPEFDIESDLSEHIVKSLLADIAYAKKQNFDQNTIDTFQDTLKSYFESQKDKGVDEREFLRELLLKEQTFFIRNGKGLGLKRENMDLVRASYIAERLKFIGIDESKAPRDQIVALILDQAEKIVSFPYEGCESELTSLYILALNHVERPSEGESEITDEETIMLIRDRIYQKMKKCIEYESLVDHILEKSESVEPQKRTIDGKGRYVIVPDK